MFQKHWQRGERGKERKGGKKGKEGKNLSSLPPVMTDLQSTNLHIFQRKELNNIFESLLKAHILWQRSFTPMTSQHM